MFYCDKCRTNYSWPESLTRSLGPCESCGRVASCNDVPSSVLPNPRSKKKVS